MGVGQLSESDAVDALRLPFYSSSHPTGSHGWRNQFDMGNPDYDLYPWSMENAKATFYSNPYVDKPLPDWTKSITHAEYSGGEVSIVEGIPPCTLLRDYEVIGNPFG